MLNRIFLLLFLALLGRSQAQLSTPPPKSVKGTLIAFVDDHANIFVNGNKVFHGDLGTSRSREIALKAGDHVVVQLVNDGGPRWFLLAFESTDGTTIASFRANDFRIVPGTGLTYFNPVQFKEWTKPARDIPGRRREKVLDGITKNYSDAVWGDLDRCTLACIVTPQMFSQRPK